MNFLPDELLINIMEFTSIEDILNLRKVNHKFNRLAKDEFLLNTVITRESERKKMTEFLNYAQQLFNNLSKIFLWYHIKNNRMFKGSGKTKKGRGTLFRYSDGR